MKGGVAPAAHFDQSARLCANEALADALEDPDSDPNCKDDPQSVVIGLHIPIHLNVFVWQSALEAEGMLCLQHEIARTADYGHL